MSENRSEHQSDDESSEDSLKGSEISRQIGNFAGQLYGKLVENESTENLLISPLSIQVATMVVFLGTSGDTAQELCQGLLLGTDNLILIQAWCKEIFEDVWNNSGVRIASKIYITKRFNLNPEFCESAKNSNTEIEPINFISNIEAVQKMNEWVEKKIGIQKDMINQDDVNENTSCIILNAVFFKAKWKHGFIEGLSHSDHFYISETESVEVVYMRQWRNMFHAYVQDGFAKLFVDMVVLPFADENFSMVLLSPLDFDSFSVLERRLLEPDSIYNIIWKVDERDIELFIPRFQIETLVDLKDPFIKMNMSKMFSQETNFTEAGVKCNEISVDKFIHLAIIKISEDGVESCSNNVRPDDYAAKNASSRIVKLNKPFIYLVLDSEKNILLMGKFMKPQEAEE